MSLFVRLFRFLDCSWLCGGRFHWFHWCKGQTQPCLISVCFSGSTRLVLYLSGPLASPPFCHAVFQPWLYGGSAGEHRRVCLLFLPKGSASRWANTFARSHRDAGRGVLLVCARVEMGVRRTHALTAVLFLSRASVKSGDRCFFFFTACSVDPPTPPHLVLPESEKADLMLTHRVSTCLWGWWTRHCCPRLQTRRKHTEPRHGGGLCSH